jgi:hypothetical protein
MGKMKDQIVGDQVEEGDRSNLSDEDKRMAAVLIAARRLAVIYENGGDVLEAMGDLRNALRELDGS